MKVGIVGFAGSGKSMLFQWLTGVTPDRAASQRGQVGMAKIADERLDWLSAHFRPKKTTPATIEFLDTPGLLVTERRDNPQAEHHDCSGRDAQPRKVPQPRRGAAGARLHAAPRPASLRVQPP